MKEERWRNELHPEICLHNFKLEEECRLPVKWLVHLAPPDMTPPRPYETCILKGVGKGDQSLQCVSTRRWQVIQPHA